MTSKFKAAIFDMDGTVLDSMRFWRFGCIDYLLVHQLPVPDELFREMYTASSTEMVLYALDKIGIQGDREEIWKELCARMRRHYIEDVKPKAHAREYIEKLRAQGVVCCVATASPKDMAHVALARHGLHGCFAFITNETQIGATKHESLFYERVIEKLGVAPDDCMVFEDALYSIETAKGMGLRVCAIEDECARNERDEIRKIADLYIKDYGELL